MRHRPALGVERKDALCHDQVTMRMRIQAGAEKLRKKHSTHARVARRRGTAGPDRGFDGAHADAQHRAKVGSGDGTLYRYTLPF